MIRPAAQDRHKAAERWLTTLRRAAELSQADQHGEDASPGPLSRRGVPAPVDHLDGPFTGGRAQEVLLAKLGERQQEMRMLQCHDVLHSS